MADQFAGVDAWGMPYNQPYEEDYYYDAPPTNVAHTYSQTVQELDYVDNRPRRYSAIDFDSTQYMNGFNQYNDNIDPIDKPDTHYAEHAARQKIAQLATIARRHENLLKQQQQAIEAENKRAEDNIYQKVERPKNRKQWVNGTHVLVQRDKSTQWFHGTIVNIYYNAMSEEVLTVLYYEFKGAVKYKTVRRYDKNVKAPNEDAWELFKKEEEKNMTLYQKLFTGIKGVDNNLYDDDNNNNNIGEDLNEIKEGDNKENEEGENVGDDNDEDNEDVDGDGDVDDNKKKRKKDKKNKKDKKKKDKKGKKNDKKKKKKKKDKDVDGDVDDGDKKKHRKKKKGKKKKREKNK